MESNPASPEVKLSFVMPFYNEEVISEACSVMESLGHSHEVIALTIAAVIARGSLSGSCVSPGGFARFPAFAVLLLDFGKFRFGDAKVGGF